MSERGPDGPGVIVVGVDGAEGGWRAAAYAVGMARRQGAVLAVVHVQSVTPFAAAFSVAPAVAEAAWHTAREVEARVREGIERAGDTLGTRVEFYAMQGEVAACLAHIAGRLRADAIVVGACHRLTHRAFGSPSVRLVRSGRRPVIIVP